MGFQEKAYAGRNETKKLMPKSELGMNNDKTRRGTITTEGGGEKVQNTKL